MEHCLYLNETYNDEMNDDLKSTFGILVAICFLN